MDAPVDSAGETFAPGVPTDGTWKFNSYRVTYRYEPWRKDTCAGFLGEAKGLQDQYLPAIREKARTVSVAQVLQEIWA